MLVTWFIRFADPSTITTQHLLQFLSTISFPYCFFEVKPVYCQWFTHLLYLWTPGGKEKVGSREATIASIDTFMVSQFQHFTQYSLRIKEVNL